TLVAPEADSYLWSTGETTQSILVSPDSTTTYSVTINENGCDFTDDITVNVTAFPDADAGADVDICLGESVVLTASGGDSYEWNTGETTASITVSPEQTTAYFVTISSNNCQATDDVIVTVSEYPEVNAGNDITICQGESVTLTANSNSELLWNTGQSGSSITVSPDETTTYTVTASQGGCETTDEVTVFVNPLPEAFAGNDVNITAGDSVTLTASGGDSFLWSTGESTSSIMVSPDQTTAYSVTVTTNGCSDSDEVVVIVDGEVMANAGQDVTICRGDTATLTATGGDAYLWSTGETTAVINVSPDITTEYTVTVTSGNSSDSDAVMVFVNELPTADAGDDVTICDGESIILTASGGSEFLWNTGQTSASIEVSPSTTTTYEVTVIENGCQATDQVTVIVNPAPEANAGPDVTIEEGESTTLTASGGISYLWSNGETTASITVSPNETTMYTVTAFSNGGCEDSDWVQVNVNPGQANANAGEDVTICQGETVTLTATGGGTYLWSTGETTQSINVSPASTTNYTVIVTVGSDSDSDSVTVQVNANPDVQVSGDVTILNGNYVTLSASGADEYIWSNGATEPNIAVNPSVTTIYTVTGYTHDCSETEEIEVNVLQPVMAYAGSDQTICEGSSITLTASGGDSYVWSTGETTQSITVSPSQDTIYSVIVSNELDSDADEVMVMVENCDEDAIIDEFPQDVPPFQYVIYESSPNSKLYYAKIIGLDGPASLIIQDIQGKLVYWQDIGHNNGQRQDIPVNTNLYSQGIYTITLQEQERSTTKKVLFR
ncbi:MAG: T9SS type A sorting domain-containing protein, partial [Bacteroidia bacterium]|nr:T9SS type A sorting domain-containing protein [Bacteroidia bacterium]